MVIGKHANYLNCSPGTNWFKGAPLRSTVMQVVTHERMQICHFTCQFLGHSHTPTNDKNRVRLAHAPSTRALRITVCKRRDIRENFCTLCIGGTCVWTRKSICLACIRSNIWFSSYWHPATPSVCSQPLPFGDDCERYAFRCIRTVCVPFLVEDSLRRMQLYAMTCL